jgi:hypothetical protein
MSLERESAARNGEEFIAAVLRPIADAPLRATRGPPPGRERRLRACYNFRMAAFGKILLGMGLFLVVLGALLIAASRFGLPIGRLPGDFHWRSRSGHTQVYFPFATSILLSILLTLILWFLGSFRR